MLVKLCGFRDEITIDTAISSGCNFLGFIFCDKSPRNITPKNAALISKNIPNSIAKVAVVVDASFDFLAEIVENFSPDYFQFHGDENIEYLHFIRKKFPNIKIIKAFKIKDKSDLNRVNDFSEVADFFLFDSKVNNESGGTGQKFDWNIIKDFKSKKDWFLSGGLNIDNIEEAIKITDVKMIDISSGIEKTRGQKSSTIIKNFMNRVKELYAN